MFVSFRRLLTTALVLGLGATTAHAQTPARLTAEQSKQLDAYMKQVGKVKPKASVTTESAQTLTAPSVSRSSDVATVAAPDSQALDALLALNAPPSVPAGISFGIASGFGIQPSLPELSAWDKNAAQAIVAAFAAPAANATADDVATFAAIPASDPVFEERVNLVRTLFHVDGTEQLIRHFVSTEHMKLIIQEVARHIDFNKLTDTDRYRLAAIAAVAQTELEDKVIDMNARAQAGFMSKSELMQLIVAYDIDPQRKLTQLRLNDDGKIDRAAELDLRLAQYQIVKQYEAGQ